MLHAMFSLDLDVLIHNTVLNSTCIYRTVLVVQSQGYEPTQSYSKEAESGGQAAC